MSDRKMYLKFYDSVGEFFEGTHRVSAEQFEDKLKGMNKLLALRFATQEDSFFGNHEELYQKWKRHDVKKEAGMMSGVLSEINTADFEEQKWEFKQRLEEGDVIDVNRYLDGHERFWSGVRRTMRTKQVVRVYFNIGGNCKRKETELAVSGALAVTLTEVLESMGIGVELWACAFSTGVGHMRDEKCKCVDGGTLIKLKGSDEFSDLGIINYMCGNAKVFRNQMLISLCQLAEDNGIECDSGLGRHREASASDIGLTDDEDKNAIFVPSFYEVEDAKVWLKNMFTNLNETLGKTKKKED